jgi:cobalt/nickel transport system permease protein
MHRLHPALLCLATLAVLLCALSLPTRDIVRFLPYLSFPLAFALLGGIPLWPLLARMAVAAPLPLALALPSLLLEREVAFVLGPLPVTGGLLVLASVTLRAALGVSAALVLASLVGIEGIVASLRWLGVPRMLRVQLLLLYRYLALLAEEASRLLVARGLRAFGRSVALPEYGALVGSLLLRASARGGRIEGAMALRGGWCENHLVRDDRASVGVSLSFLLLCLALALILRFGELPLGGGLP